MKVQSSRENRKASDNNSLSTTSAARYWPVILLYSFSMGKGAPLRWLENKLLARHLRGRGVEVGALWREFPVLSSAKVYYVNRLSNQDLQRHYAEVNDSL